MKGDPNDDFPLFSFALPSKMVNFIVKEVTTNTILLISIEDSIRTKKKDYEARDSFFIIRT